MTLEQALQGGITDPDELRAFVKKALSPTRSNTLFKIFLVFLSIFFPWVEPTDEIIS